MPFYEYRCPTCGQRQTTWQSFIETSSPWCPNCGRGNLDRVTLHVSVVLSGTDSGLSLRFTAQDQGT
jgi:putative FmdB family regulatory protein